MATASAVSIGVFDGVHRGHQSLIARLRERADAAGLRAIVVTFDPHPMSVVRPALAPLMLTTVERRIELLKAAGADEVKVLHFDEALSHQSPEAFVEDTLRGELDAGTVVVGERFRFGHHAAGDVDLMRELGLDVEAVALLTGGDSEVVSSSWIRHRIAEGDVAGAALGLGRLHAVEGPVGRGDARGRELGFPTANVGFDPTIAVPADGVYSAWLVRADATRLPAAVSVGTNPTFNGSARTVEAYVIGAGHDLDLYDERVAVEFVTHIRPMLKFDSVDALIETMNGDVAAATAALGYA